MIKKDSVVTLSYSLKNKEGAELDKAGADQPLVYLHGKGQIIPGLETKLEGLNSGDKKDVTVQPEDAYGNVNPSLVMEIERQHFPKDVDIQPGMQFTADMGEKQQIFTVLSVGEEQIKIDANHPLAGETLHFSIEVLDVREATKEELDHGHAHTGNEHGH
ncbi:FKBP-type peptidyl-prolyl cis-trans isomerase [Nitrospina sp. 32_T5]|uniref:FKBP-type peptidyl-prolyl cis-trans isomerase n=1 Tax=unclassified Nitrospina TaxID=2638683 RepID=UPI003F97151D